MLRQSDGTRKRTRPSSRSGLTTITLPRRRRRATSCPTRRGWLLAGFAPATRARSAAARSSSPTDAVPEPLGAHERHGPEELLPDRAGHVAGLRLHGLLADLGEVTSLVRHAAELAAHSHPARLARVPRTQPSVETEEAARLPSLAEDVCQRGEAAAGADARASHAAKLSQLRFRPQGLRNPANAKIS